MICHWNPASELSRLQNTLFNNEIFNTERAIAFRPLVDIYEDKEAIYLKAELPGTRLEDIHVQVDKDRLTIRGERALEHQETKENYHRIERSYGSFSRTFVLPHTVDSDNIQARLEHGILTLRVPKKEEAKPRKIEVTPGTQTN